MAFELSSGSITVSDDRDRLNLDVIHGYLSRSYWSPGISREAVRQGMENAHCFGVYEGPAQIGFARVITDYTGFGYLCDVFILETHQGRGYAKLLLQAIMAHPRLQGFRRWQLATRDAHGLYAQFGFTPLKEPQKYMEKRVG